MINDNRALDTWPKRTITDARSVPKSRHDHEPYEQRITLECGHWLLNTHGDRFPKFHIGEQLRCRTCGEGSRP